MISDVTSLDPELLRDAPREGTERLWQSGRADGTEAVFNVSIKDGMTGEGEPGEVRADYVIGRGE